MLLVTLFILNILGRENNMSIFNSKPKQEQTTDAILVLVKVLESAVSKEIKEVADKKIQELINKLN